MSKTVVLVDMDMTLNKMSDTFTDYLKKYYPWPLEEPKEENMTKYEMMTWYRPKIPQHLHEGLMSRVFGTRGFWEAIPPQEHAAEVMEAMDKKFDVHIVTSPWIDYKDCYKEKRNWVEEHLPFFDVVKIIFTRNKHLINGDVIIDDAPHYLDEFPNEKIIFDQPYNRKTKGDHRVTDWLEIREILWKEY